MPSPPTSVSHPETRFAVPTTLAGVLAGRAVEDMFKTFRIPVPDNLFVDNTRSPSKVTLHVNGHQRSVAAGGTLEVREKEVGRIAAYGIMPEVAITLGDVEVLERRVGNRGVA